MAKKSSKTGSTKKKKKELKPAGNKIFHVGIYDEQHRKNLQQRAKKVQQLYKQAVDKITKAAQPTLFGADPNLSEFHFSDFPTLNKAVDKYIQQMGAGLQSNIEQGDAEAWTLSNTKNDAMVDYLAGTYNIPKETLKEWKHPHLEALESFMERKTKGMNLSNGGSETSKLVGVWNLDQFKNELELALELGIGKGKSAAELSKDVRQYLKYPNKLFRRVRDKSGALRLSKAAAAFHPGRGVYRSSYRNALRLTATENNIAYRTCDHKRWQALDFVLGQEIRLSNNHTLNGKPFTDICDELAGKYPKEFKFTGWHPWCRCYSVSILADEAEVDEYCKLIAEGKSVANFKFTGALTPDDMPKEFKEWVKANEDRIAGAKQMPYFLKDNPALLEKAGYTIPKEQHDLFDWSEKLTKPLTLLEKAELRHQARTQEQIDDILKRWQKHEEHNQQLQSIIDTALQAAKEMPEVDYTPLTEAIAKNELNNAADVAKMIQQKVADMKKEEYYLSTVIPDVHNWHKQFTISELQTVKDSVLTKYNKWALKSTSDKYFYKKAKFELEWIEQNHPSYKTIEVAKATYQAKMEECKFNIDVAGFQAKITELDKYDTKSYIYKNLLGEAQNKLLLATQGDQASLDAVGKALENVEKKKEKLEAAKTAAKQKKAAKAAKNATKDADATATNTAEDAVLTYSKERRNNALWDTNNGLDADKVLRKKNHEKWMAATKEQRQEMYNYTEHYCDKNEPLELRHYYDTEGRNPTRAEWERKVNAMTDYINTTELPQDMWFQRGDDWGAITGRLGFVGETMPSDIQDLVGMTMQEGGFMSTASSKYHGFDNKEVILNIFAPKGTKAAYCEPFSYYGCGSKSPQKYWKTQTHMGHEDETLFQRGTIMKITKVEKSGHQTFIDVEVIGQEAKDISYVPDSLIN